MITISLKEEINFPTMDEIALQQYKPTRVAITWNDPLN